MADYKPAPPKHKHPLGAQFVMAQKLQQLQYAAAHGDLNRSVRRRAR